jgi:hypothetical protein
VTMEGINSLERPQSSVELSGVPVERVERGLDTLLLVALFGHGQVLDPRKRLAAGRLWRGPGFGLH